MTSSKYDYTAIEDNAGGLHLYLFAPGTEDVAMAFDGFEYTPGSLIESLAALDGGDDATTWDGRKADGQADWDEAKQWIPGPLSVICYADAGEERTIYPDRMGRAGHIEFGIVVE